jgi:hypothetical protein
MNVVSFHKEDFFRLCKEYVDYYPKNSLRCKTLQTFAVLESYTHLNTPNLGKTLSDRNKPFFWSRAWARANYSSNNLSYDYPVMAQLERPSTYHNILDSVSLKLTTIEIAVLDKYDSASHNKSDGCKSRTINEIYIDTSYMLLYLFSFLKGIVYVGNNEWTQKDIQVASGDTRQVDETITRHFQKLLKTHNKSINTQPWDGGLDDLYGTITEIILPTEICDDFTYNAEGKTFELGYHKNCC